LTVSMFETDTDESNLVIGMVEDITEQKRTESALRESEERFRRLSTAAFEGIFIHQGGLILDANDQLAQLLGFLKGDELVGRNGWRHVGVILGGVLLNTFATKTNGPLKAPLLQRVARPSP
jgi:PAS domain-containing protein